MNTKTASADMNLLQKAFIHPSNDPDTMFDSIPISFKINGNTKIGIPDCFKRSYTREIVDANITRYEYKGICEKCGLEIKVIHTEYRDFPVSEWVAYFTNTGKNDSAVISDIMLGGEITGNFKELHHGNGDTQNDTGYHWFRDPISKKTIIKPSEGTSCKGAFPYMKLVFEGFVCRVAIGWPHMWKAELERTENGIHYTCGQKRCNFKMLPGETMRTPTLTIMISEGDETRSMNLWRRRYMAHIIPREDGHPITPKLCLHYQNCDGLCEHTGATEENQINALNVYINRGLKPDIWWIDAGWYECKPNEWSETGTWKPDKKRFPNGLAPIGKECEKVGAKFLLWFEPERLVTGTELYNEHPEWILDRDDTVCEKKGYLLDYSKKEAVDFMLDRIDGIIKECNIKIYRQDFNINPEPYWVYNEAEDRIGAIENLHVQGYLRLWDEILFRNPGLWIDSCSSGGRRNDLDTMRRSVPLHYTDVGYGVHEVKQLQSRQMHEWIPYFRAFNFSWDKDKVEAAGMEWIDNDEFSFMNAITPSVTYMVHYKDSTDEEYERACIAEKIWRHSAPLTLYGDYYPLIECRMSLEDWYACQFDDSDNNKGFIQLVRNIYAENDRITVYPHVEDGKAYVFTNASTGESFTKTADELKHGFSYSLPKRSGAVLFYEII